MPFEFALPHPLSSPGFATGAFELKRRGVATTISRDSLFGSQTIGTSDGIPVLPAAKTMLYQVASGMDQGYIPLNPANRNEISVSNGSEISHGNAALPAIHRGQPVRSF